MEPDITRDERGFTVLVRNAMFQCVRALARHDWTAAAAIFAPTAAGPAAPGPAAAAGAARTSPGDDEWSAARFEQAFRPFFEEHAGLRVDPTARAPQNTGATKTERGTWEVVQVLCDDEGDDDWVLAATVDLEASAKAGRPVLAMRSVSR